MESFENYFTKSYGYKRSGDHPMPTSHRDLKAKHSVGPGSLRNLRENGGRS